MKKLALFISFLLVISCTKDPIIYTLTTSANPADGGTVSPSTQQYDEGETATITATPSSEYVFQSWSGATGSTNSTSVVMNSDKSVTANFVKKKYSLNVMVEGEGTVNEKVIKAGAATDYNSGTIVELTAVPSGEWLFVEWTGDVTGTENPTQITIDKAKNVTAVFVKKQYPLTIEIEGEGTVTEKVIKAGVATDYNSGTIVELTAEPTGDWAQFEYWTGDVNSNETTIQLTIDKPTSIKAVFKEKNLIVNKTITRVDVPGQSTGYLRASFYNVSGPFHYLSENEHYFFYPGTVFWGQNKPNSKDEIPPSPSHVLKKVDGLWKYHKTYDDVVFWGARNFETFENKVVVGDGNEIGPDGTDWNGDTYYGEIHSQGEINWVKVNDDENRGFYHGTTFGDLNNDGLLDIGGAPGQWYEQENKWRLKVFIQKGGMQFENNDLIFEYNETGHSLPFTMGFADLFGDSYGEIITADYGGGDPYSNSKLNRIEIFKYDSNQKKYVKHFESSQPTAFYDIGMGATSIKAFDFDNDGVKDISIAREDQKGNAFEIWKGNGDGTFEPHFVSPLWSQNELQFREFLVFDANNDGYLDILLRPFHYGRLYRTNPVWWDVYASKGIKLNHLIWLNNGNGTFSYYSKKDLIIDDILVDNVHPYMDKGILHYSGSFTTDEGALYGQDAIDLTTYDIKVNLN